MLFDPCAGDGAAVAALAEEWSPPNPAGRFRVVACEMEATRAAALQERLPHPHDTTFHGDAFSLDKRSPEGYGASVLYLNPPYDTDEEYGRLEQRFLERFTPWIAPGDGWLFFVIPLAALAASIRYLATHFTRLGLYRFPDGDFERFGQVVIVANRRDEPRSTPDPVLLGYLERGIKNPLDLPIVRTGDPNPQEAAFSWSSGYGLSCELLPFDPVATLEKARPFAECGFADTDTATLFEPTYTTAAPPRAAHIAMALSAGIFNGQRLAADEPERFPPLLVKGVFEREWLRVKERRDEDGEFQSAVEIERPKLRLTVLRLDTYTYQTLGAGTVPSGSEDLSEWNAADLLLRYGEGLSQELYRRFDTLHDPGRTDQQIVLPDLPRKPYRIQNHAIQTALKLLAQRKNPFFVAEVGDRQDHDGPFDRGVSFTGPLRDHGRRACAGDGETARSLAGPADLGGLPAASTRYVGGRGRRRAARSAGRGGRFRR